MARDRLPGVPKFIIIITTLGAAPHLPREGHGEVSLVRMTGLILQEAAVFNNACVFVRERINKLPDLHYSSAE
jgi:hypothetical protein